MKILSQVSVSTGSGLGRVIYGPLLARSMGAGTGEAGEGLGEGGICHSISNKILKLENINEQNSNVSIYAVTCGIECRTRVCVCMI